MVTIVDRINELRFKLNKTLEEDINRVDEDVLKLSMRLDSLIVKYEKLRLVINNHESQTFSRIDR